MPSWTALLGPERTDNELAAMRVEYIQGYGMGEMSFTCDDCPAKRTCGFVFDLYNTNGDCLAEK